MQIAQIEKFNYFNAKIGKSFNFYKVYFLKLFIVFNKKNKLRKSAQNFQKSLYKH